MKISWKRQLSLNLSNVRITCSDDFVFFERARCFAQITRHSRNNYVIYFFNLGIPFAYHLTANTYSNALAQVKDFFNRKKYFEGHS